MQFVDRDTLFLALTRPQMFAGVTYNYFILNFILSTELFLIFGFTMALLTAAIVHVVGVILSARDNRFFDVWLTLVRNCPRIRNYSIWKCNSYRP